MIFKLEVGKTYKTKCGHIVKILATDAVGDCPIIGQFLGCGSMGLWYEDGRSDFYGNFPITEEVCEPALNSTVKITKDEIRQIIKQRIESISKIIAKSFETGVAAEAISECERAFELYKETEPILKELLENGQK